MKPRCFGSRPGRICFGSGSDTRAARVRSKFFGQEQMISDSSSRLSRREFAALACAAPVGVRAAPKARVPIGLLLFAVRDDLARDLPGTLRAVSKMGYQGVEFFGPYFGWSGDYARQVRAHSMT